MTKAPVPATSAKWLSEAALGRALCKHWQEYLIEAFGLGAFMVSAGVVTTLLYSPDSGASHWITAPLLRRALTGLAMGATAIAIIYSPWGRRSGAHLNPAVTLAFYRLGKVTTPDAIWYGIAQTAGGLVGVLLTWAALGVAFSDPPVSFVVTVPGPAGPEVAALAEFLISMFLMLSILVTSNRLHLMRYTGLFSGLLIALYVTFESPYSGMSMNPSRTLASALPAVNFSALYLYLLVPPLGMLAAVEVYRMIGGHAEVACAKLNHVTRVPCHFICDFDKHGIDVIDVLASHDAAI
jgi:aquaporin Z